MNPVKVFIPSDRIACWHDGRGQLFPTTGRDDPRIQEAITRCRAAGYTIQVFN